MATSQSSPCLQFAVSRLWTAHLYVHCISPVVYFSLSQVNSYIGFVIYLVISVFGVRIKTIITELRLFDMYHLLKYLSNFCAECSTVLIKAVVLVSWSNKNRRLSKPILSLVIF